MPSYKVFKPVDKVSSIKYTEPSPVNLPEPLPKAQEVLNYVWDGSAWQVMKSDSDGNIQVDVLTMPNVTVSSMPTTTVTQSATKTHNVYNFLEYLMENGTLIIERGELTGVGTDTIYTVPAGKTFYLNFAQIRGKCDGYIYINTNASIILGLSWLTAEALQHAESSFAIPIRLPAGSTIVLYGGYSTISGYIVGYLV